MPAPQSVYWLPREWLAPARRRPGYRRPGRPCRPRCGASDCPSRPNPPFSV